VMGYCLKPGNHLIGFPSEGKLANAKHLTDEVFYTRQ
jgi:hypothetical protein